MAGAVADRDRAIIDSTPLGRSALVIWVAAGLVAELLLVCDWMRAYLEQAASVHTLGHWGEVSSLGTWGIGALGGLVFGLGGWFALRVYGAVGRQWLAATATGWMLAAALSSVARPAGLNDAHDWYVLPMGLLGGLVLGTSQWLVLRRVIDWGAALWIVVAAGGWTANWLLPFAIRFVRDPITPPVAITGWSASSNLHPPAWSPGYPAEPAMILYTGVVLLVLGATTALVTGFLTGRILRALVATS
jgi:hypothetical protein